MPNSRANVVEFHLLAEDRLCQLGEASHCLQIGRARRAEREHPRVLDEKDVVLADVVREAVLGQRAVGDAAHEGVRVLGLPEARRPRSQLVGKAAVRHPGGPYVAVSEHTIPSAPAAFQPVASGPLRRSIRARPEWPRAGRGAAANAIGVNLASASSTVSAITPVAEMPIEDFGLDQLPPRVAVGWFAGAPVLDRL